ncbi:MAG: hypothetical protein KatS3mg108_3750 [Isosphaeraceae bacterium]|jgi:tetratricopeptide (TPR) repeat protein|nr:MAG: hypothetical protein KatS3mg108_3750 [Isosphaeraceae bacterium]
MTVRTPVAILIVLVPVVAWSADELADARVLWQTGKYAEAEEAFAKLAEKADDRAVQAGVALGLADCAASQGEYEQAIEVLSKAIDADPANADLRARRASIWVDRGRWEEADRDVAAALEVEPDHLAARWVAARLLELRGKKAEAVDAWKWFIDYQNAHPAEVKTDAEALLVIGQAAERYYRAKARGEQLKETLQDVINTVYEAALEADPNCWQAAWRQGELFLSGYNERAALKELARASRINPSAAEVIVALGRADLQGYKLGAGREKAEGALEINPRCVPALVLLADLNISDERFDEALEAATKAVAENPRDEEALARLAAARRLLVDRAGFERVEAEVLAINPRPAAFYAALGERLGDRRKYDDAERALRRAMECDPDNPGPSIGLGMLFMQIGREDEARQLFEAAFDADPFNVRALNMMKVLDHLADYEKIETEHYRVFYLPDQDRLLARYMARFLEAQHPELERRFGYRVPGKTTIEIMKDHQWFSGRTVGLPFVPTVGACTGKVVALASPRATKKPFNWSRVMVHEVTHVITLQQTEFNIPHWFTEALAVESEQTPRPQAWNTMLAKRIPARRLLNLDTINLGFIRPKEPEERQLAYAQAQLYAQYMTRRFGDEAIARMLDAYRRGLTTDRAIADAFGVEKADFEAGYLAFLDEVVRTIRTRVDEEEPVSFSQLEQQVKANPEDADLQARMAYEHFARRDLKAARPFADAALKLKPHHPLASYVKARLLTSIGDDQAALELLRPALDPERPNERVVDLLAELEMKAGNLDEAARLYELARQDDPTHSKWIAGLARVHLRQNNRAALLEDLAKLAANDSDDLAVRRTLADYHLKDQAYAAAERWAMECLYIDVYDPAHHLMLADALAGQSRHAEAIEEYEIALELKPKRPAEIQVKRAQSLRAVGRDEEARSAVEAALEADPEHPEALELKRQWESGGEARQ